MMKILKCEVVANIDAVTTSGAVLGAALVHLRTVKGMKQAELATAVGLSASTWSRIEKGESGLSIDQLRQVAKVLGTTPGDILDLQEKWEAKAVKTGLRVAEGTVVAGAASLMGTAAGTTALLSVGPVAMVLPVFGAALLRIIEAAFAADTAINKDGNGEQQGDGRGN